MPDRVSPNAGSVIAPTDISHLRCRAAFVGDSTVWWEQLWKNAGGARDRDASRSAYSRRAPVDPDPLAHMVRCRGGRTRDEPRDPQLRSSDAPDRRAVPGGPQASPARRSHTEQGGVRDAADTRRSSTDRSRRHRLQTSASDVALRIRRERAQDWSASGATVERGERASTNRLTSLDDEIPAHDL